MEDKVRELAYYKWEAAGRPEGQADYFWQEAEKEVGGKVVTASAVVRPHAHLRQIIGERIDLTNVPSLDPVVSDND